MIRQDYILAMIDQLRRVLVSIADLKKERRWHEIAGTIDEEFKHLVGAGAAEVTRFSETELMARLVQGESTQFVRDKTHILVALFKEAGEAATAQDRAEEGRIFYLKGLHLLLGTVSGGDFFNTPDFVPELDVFLAALSDEPLPPRTLVMLTSHYEQRGAFAKAEDVLFELLDAEWGAAEALKFGIAFYERLRSQSDLALANGNLPRPEVEAGIAELLRRQVSSG
jgi:hypothetical protein